jgi:hypothetical protein
MIPRVSSRGMISLSTAPARRHSRQLSLWKGLGVATHTTSTSSSSVRLPYLAWRWRHREFLGELTRWVGRARATATKSALPTADLVAVANLWAMAPVPSIPPADATPHAPTSRPSWPPAAQQDSLHIRHDVGRGILAPDSTPPYSRAPCPDRLVTKKALQGVKGRHRRDLLLMRNPCG